ncbi:hypothetical protein ACFQ0T_19055 [Kitasatospora gansuensis]
MQTTASGPMPDWTLVASAAGTQASAEKKPRKVTAVARFISTISFRTVPRCSAPRSGRAPCRARRIRHSEPNSTVAATKARQENSRLSPNSSRPDR